MDLGKLLEEIEKGKAKIAELEDLQTEMKHVQQATKIFEDKLSERLKTVITQAQEALEGKDPLTAYQILIKNLQGSEETKVKSAPFQITDLENYLLIPGEVYAKNSSYPELLWAVHRLSLTEEVEAAGRRLNLPLSNTALKPDHNPEYIGKITHGQALNIVFELNPQAFVQPTVYFNRILAHLYSYPEKVHNGNGDLINSDLTKKIRDEIIEKREPLRGEYLGNSYILVDNQLYTQHIELTPQGSVKAISKPLDDSYLKGNLHIDLEKWLKDPTKDGLPRERGNSHIQFGYPKHGSVALFRAGPRPEEDSVRATLNCIRCPTIWSSDIGVRFCIPKHAQ